ncbi:hypothetical protein GCM10007160_43370 [Litchfieldella qijiaojingensis]|uniref:Histidine phosphatase family protein n=1 Tax=Litchfieldella qijiaojingensis TaxID=980347 RepID=A0ABQ2ZG28_9GAMM|nr:histidine phosphatase family protein [Halomonas qijiaojingensis]GGY11749.1 hypothetical protein GCM10007160_43370 [Halomonas qijiaojingensis]
MKQLFLIRHAKSSWADGSLADHERPLKRHGRRQAEAMAKPLQALGAFDGAIHASDASRVRQTLEGFDAALPELTLSERVHYHPALYTFEEKRLRRWLKDANLDDDCLTLVGHNPALLALAQRLTNQQVERLPTGSQIHLVLPITSWQQLDKARGKVVVTLTPTETSHALFKRKAPKPPASDDSPLAKRLTRQLAHRYRMIRTLEPGVVADFDPEFLHQYRVCQRH